MEDLTGLVRAAPPAREQGVAHSRGPISSGEPHDLNAVDETDMRTIVRLLGETAALRGGLLAKKCYILDGLCNLVGAHEWRWAIFQTPKPEAGELCTTALSHKLESSDHFTDTCHLEPLELLPPSRSGPGIILSSRSLDKDETSRIALHRQEPGAPYTLREVRLASLVLDDIPWLHFREQTRQSPRPKLSPRLQHILDLLLLGLSRKEISALLGISKGTVGGYVRELYAHFRVNSQAEFMRIHLRNTSRH